MSIPRQVKPGLGRSAPRRKQTERRSLGAFLAGALGGLCLLLSASAVGAAPQRAEPPDPFEVPQRPAPAPGSEAPQRPAPAPGSEAPSRPAPPLEGAAPPDPTPNDSIRDSSVRYRFIESYRPPDAANSEDGIGAFRVALIETIDTQIESAQAAPERSRVEYAARYVARPATVGGAQREQVSALMRRYEQVRVRRDGQIQEDPLGPTALADHELYLIDRGGPAPETLWLDPNRPLTQRQFRFVAYQQTYVPRLSGLIPNLYKGIGDEWYIDTSAAEALLGNRILEGTLKGMLTEIRDEPDGVTRRAIIRVTGAEVQTLTSVVSVNARLEFVFEEPEDEALANRGPGFTARGIDARGAIVKLRLAQREYTDLAGSTGLPTRGVRERKLILERRLRLEGQQPPSVPDPPPAPNPDNSWVLYRDPDDRFQFRHPQQFLAPPTSGGQAGIQLLRPHPRLAGPDEMYVEFVPQDRTPEDEFVRTLVEGFRAAGVQVGTPNAGALPEADWPGRRVYRVELPLTYVPSSFTESGRAYLFAYLVRFSRDATLYLRATTTQLDPLAFRDELEQILRTAELDPPPLQIGD